MKTQNGSGSHFQVDETGLPPVAAGSHFQVDQAGVLPVPAGAKGAGYLSPRVRARMAELQLTQADLAGIAGQRKRRAGHDQGSRKFSRRNRRDKPAEKRERDPHRRGRCDAAQLDATARHGGRFRLSRSGVARSRRSAIRNRALRFTHCARSRLRSGGTTERRRAPDRRTRASAPNRSTSASRSKRRTASWFRSFATPTRLRSPT